MTKLLDANVIIRYLTDDDPQKSAKFEKLLKTSKVKLLLTDVTIAEIVWVLESHYQLAKQSIVEKISALILLSTIKANQSLIAKALKFFSQLNIDYIDAYLSAYALENKVEQIISYDQDLDKVKEVKRIEP